jgi:hypothetical protein
MNPVFKIILLATSLILLQTGSAFAGPPFLTDDPVPVDFRHWEAYLFASGDHTGGGYNIGGPAVEVNYGVLPDLQLHLVGQLTSVGGNGTSSATGLGDTEFGGKYRLVQETNGWPQLAIFPLAELPTGEAGRGLGNGRAWFKLPLWLQKSYGAWTLDVGGGVALNSAPGQRDYPYGGVLVQRAFGPQLMLGGELFAQGPDTAGGQGYAALNFGGTYTVNDYFSLLFSAGHSVAGENHTVWYSGLYWTW